ncbi:MAG: hypothetical protein NTW19_20980 [Planctomycetota bacterium]|nr:hypothetical protein [Planctomycetota bacterium]
MHFVLAGAATAAALPGAWIYQELLNWVPFMVVHILLPVAVGGGLGALAARMAKRGRCRNPVVAVATGAIVGATFLVAGYWVTYLDHRAVIANYHANEIEQHHWRTLKDVGVVSLPGNVDPATVRLTPDFFLLGYSFQEHLASRVKDGWRSHGTHYAGHVVYLFWLIEAALILGGSSMGGLAQSRRPYDEGSGSWMELIRLHQVSDTSRDAANRLAEADEVHPLLTLVPQVDGGDVAVTYQLAKPRDPAEPAYLTIKQVSIEPDKQGQGVTKVRTLQSMVLLSPAQTADLLQRVSKAAAAPE